MADDGVTCGQLLRHFRQQARLTQEELAERSGYSADYLSKLERDQRQPPLVALDRLADVLGLGNRERDQLQTARRRRLPGPAPSQSEAGPVLAAQAALPPVPLPPTPLLGREGELATIARLLSQPDVRLMTIVGPPGVGKTRLALEVAAYRQRDDAGGVCFVDLAPVSDSDLVVPAIARALGVRERDERPLHETLAHAVRDRHLLLVLDNCEQVLGAAPALAQLLAVCPHLALLATSRAPLRLRGEHEVPLSPLAVPEPAGPSAPPAQPPGHSPAQPPAQSDAPDRAGEAQYPAIALFVERAVAVQPTFALTEENLGDVVEVCARLDGLPLAIELAAARLRLLPLPALVERLTGRLPLLSALTGGPRDLPARQQTLRATIEWSYHLLDVADQRLFQRLGVFTGGFTLDAAEAICGHADVPPTMDALEGLERLADGSLLQRVEPAAGDTRFRLLETIREYALERLEASGEVDDVRERHAAFFLSLAEHEQARRYQPGAAAWLLRLEQDHANFRAALQWWTERGEVERALRLGTALARFWVDRGYRLADRFAGRDRLLALLATPAAARVPATRANAFVAAAVLTGNAMVAAVAARDAALDRSTGGTPSGASSGVPSGAALAAPLEAPSARWLVEQAVAIWRDLDDHDAGDVGDGAEGARAGAEAAAEQAALARATAFASAALYLASADFATASTLAERALAIWRGLNRWHAIAYWTRELGLVARDQGEYAVARDLLEEGLAVARQLADARGTRMALDRLGTVAHALGDLATARGHYAAALAACAAAGDRALEAWVRLNLGFLALDEGDPPAARAQAAEVLAIRRAEGPRAPLVHVIALCAALAAVEGQPERALRLEGAVESLWRTMGRGEFSLALPPLYRTWLDRALGGARLALGPGAAAAHAEGMAMTAEQTLADVLAYIDQSAS